MLEKVGEFMRKLAKLVTAGAMALFLMLSGCETGQENTERSAMISSNEPTLQAAGNEIVPARNIVVGFSQLGSESDWRRANTRSIQEAAKETGIQLILENAEQSQEKQFEAIRAFVKQKVDVIAIAPVVEKGWEPILREVKQVGIPVIITDRLVEVSDPSLYVSYIGSDFYEEGRMAGKYVIDKLLHAEGPVGIVELKGTEGSTPSLSRGKGFHDVIKQNPNLRVVESEYANFTVEQGNKVMRELLERRGKEIRVLFAHNDDMALGAIEAIEAYGLKPGKDIVIVSVDGTRKAFERMVAGNINSVVECNPLLGPYLMQAVKEMLDGRTLPKRIVTPERIFTEVTAHNELNNRMY